jgi:acetylornithine deacetylase
VVDVRPTDKYDNAELAEELQALCKSRLTPRNLKNKSSATQDGSPLLAAVRKLGIETFSSPTTSDWIRIHHDALKMGPGDSSRSHKADEYILVSEIEESVAKYIEFIETYYGNTVE